jgi:hypothetical protein
MSTEIAKMQINRSQHFTVFKLTKLKKIKKKQ